MINRNDFRLNELNELIYSMVLIKSADKQSFNNLTEKILKHLEKGTDENILKRVIESELCTTYGYFHMNLILSKFQRIFLNGGKILIIKNL